MTNFLDSFNNDNYEKKQENKKNGVSKDEMVAGTSTKNQTKEQNKTTSRTNDKKQTEKIETAEIFLEQTIETSWKQEEAEWELDGPDNLEVEEEVFQTVEIDENYAKKKKQKLFLAIGGGAVILISCIALFFVTQQIKMPDWINKPASDMSKWAIENKLTINKIEIYDKAIDEGNVVETAVKAGKKVWKGKSFQATISKGADPEEDLPIPDFSKMSENLIKQWIADEKATNMKIIQEFNDTAKKGAYLKTTFRSQDVNAQNYKRKDYATVYVSKGKEVFEKNIVVPDFKGKMQAEIENWAKEQSVEVTFVEVASTDKDMGQAVGQSIAPKEKIAKHDSITIDISIGKAAIVPWFGNMIKTEAMTYNKDGLMVRVTDQYSSTVPYGDMIYQSVSEGTSLTGDDKEVEVVYSLGKPYMEDLTGRTENTIAEYFYQFKAGGINATYTIHYEKNDEAPRGTVVRNSHANSYVWDGVHVDIYVSK